MLTANFRTLMAFIGTIITHVLGTPNWPKPVLPTIINGKSQAMLRNTFVIKPIEESEDEVEAITAEEEADVLELPVDLIQTTGHLIVRCPIAGAGIHDVDISLNADRLTIHKRGEVDKPEKVVREHIAECYWGELIRTVDLPKPVDPDHTRATLNNGILVITMPITSRENTRSIQIKE